MAASDFKEQYKMVEECCNAAKIQVLMSISSRGCVTISQLLGVIHSEIEELESEQDEN